MLKLVSRDLERKVEKAERDADEAKKQVAEVQSAANTAKETVERMQKEVAEIRVEGRQLTEALAFSGEVLAALDASGTRRSAEPGAIDRAIELIEKVRLHFPEMRLLGIYLGRLHHYGRKDSDRAIEALSRVIDERLKSHPGRDPDAGALLFNRACYRNVLALGEERDARGATERSAELKTDAQKDLDQAIWHDRSNEKEATTDQQLYGLRGGPP
jgi:tetratricopeptide (TPR) repeat protein